MCMKLPRTGPSLPVPVTHSDKGKAARLNSGVWATAAVCLLALGQLYKVHQW